MCLIKVTEDDDIDVHVQRTKRVVIRPEPRYRDASPLSDETKSASAKAVGTDSKPSASRSSQLHITEHVLQSPSVSNPLLNYHNSSSHAKITIASQAKPLTGGLEEESIPRFMTGDLTTETAAELPSFLNAQLDTSVGVVVM